MAKSIYGQDKPEVNFNMTPMIDCTFQLIIFFMLVTQMVSAEFVQMKLPAPINPIVVQLEDKNRVIINVVPYSAQQVADNPAFNGKSQGYSIGTTKIDRGDVEKLKRLILQARDELVKKGFKAEDFAVEIRADRSTHYLEVLPVLEAVGAAQIEKMRISAEYKKG